MQSFGQHFSLTDELTRRDWLTSEQVLPILQACIVLTCGKNQNDKNIRIDVTETKRSDNDEENTGCGNISKDERIDTEIKVKESSLVVFGFELKLRTEKDKAPILSDKEKSEMTDDLKCVIMDRLSLEEWMCCGDYLIEYFQDSVKWYNKHGSSYQVPSRYQLPYPECIKSNK